MGNDKQPEIESALELNPELAKNRQDTYSSLTDLHGIPIFSDEFDERMEEIEANYEKQEQHLKNVVFIEKNENINEAEEWSRAQLFCEKEELILTQTYSNREYKISLFDIGMIAIVVFAIAALYLFIFNDKKARRKKI